MARLSMNEMTTYRWSFEEDVAHYAAAGIPAVGVWRQKLSDYGEEKGIDLLRESGLAVSSLLWAGGFTGSDGRTYRESLDDAAEALRLAHQLHASCVVVYSGARAGHTHGHARRLVRDALAELGPLATELSVSLAIEPMHPSCAAECTFLTSLEGAMELIEAVGQPSIRLAFDTYYFGHEDDVVDKVRRLAKHIAIVHLGDSKEPPQRDQNRSLLGEGHIPLAEILAALAQAGYDGDYEVELLGEDIEISCYKSLLDQSKSAFARLLPA
ncbi:MAG: sugar phosphate isomerase/epimerase [Planctomycetia bacterium]|nr:sugar phosphate isomerase/epimerase [Planctomycetia bacterium]